MLAFVRRHKAWFFAGAVVVLVGGGFTFASVQKSRRTEAAKIAAAKVEPSPYAAIANGKADVEGGVIQVASRRAGVVREVLVQEGENVVRGQILARLEDDEPRLQAARAEAEVRQARAQIALLEVQLSTAEREQQRLAGLVSSNFVAGQRLDQSRDAVRQAQAQMANQRAAIATAEARLAEARFSQEQSVIRAPADGRIVRRYANPGAGASTLNVSNMFDLEPHAERIVRAEIPESALAAVVIGQQVELAPESDPARVVKGQVIRRAAVFGARKLTSDDPTERTDDRVVEVVVRTEGAPFLIGQRVLVKFLRPQQAQAGAPPPA